MYGCVVYAGLCNIETMLVQTNAVFSKAEIFVRKMLRWVFGINYDTRKSVMYIMSN